jgi:tetratricopeptide (TPR) repeat protein
MLAGGQGHLSASAEFYERALTISRRVHGEGHPTTASLLNNFAAVERKQGNASESLRHLEQALETKERTTGRDSPRLVTTLNNIGHALVELERPREAIPNHERALALGEREKGPEDVALVNSLLGLARAHARAGECERALELLARAERLLGAHAGAHEGRWEVPYERGRCLLEMGRSDEAEAPLAEAVAAAARLPGERTREHARALAERGRLHVTRADARGRDELERALELALATEGDPSFPARIRALLGG